MAERTEEHNKKISEALKGNQNHKSPKNIFSHVLSDAENELWDEMETDVLSQLDYDIKILTIRERRMLERIAKLEQIAFMDVRMDKTTRTSGKRKTEEKTVSAEASLLLIQQIEESLTRVQEKKARLVEAKQKYEKEQMNNDSIDIGQFVAALGVSIEGVWNDAEEQPESSHSEETDDIWGDV